MKLCDSDPPLGTAVKMRCLSHEDPPASTTEISLWLQQFCNEWINWFHPQLLLHRPHCPECRRSSVPVPVSPQVLFYLKAGEVDSGWGWESQLSALDSGQMGHGAACKARGKGWEPAPSSTSRASPDGKWGWEDWCPIGASAWIHTVPACGHHRVSRQPCSSLTS